MSVLVQCALDILWYCTIVCISEVLVHGNFTFVCFTKQPNNVVVSLRSGD